MQRNTRVADLANQNRFRFLEAGTKLFILWGKLFAVPTPFTTKEKENQKLSVHLTLLDHKQ